MRPRTVFVGGGTPSLLPPEAMERMIAGLGERFDLAGVDEWTIECNPATVSGDYLRMLRRKGVSRLSFGAQSFDEAELKALERHHRPADVGESVRLAREAGFGRVNVDLIYAIPGQDLCSWSHSLERAIALGTEHLSCYGLTYEPNTPIAVKRRLGTVVAVEEDVELQMLHHTRRRLAEAGYEAYEISNYARAGEACRHNLMYWHGGSYIGLGPSAASHAAGWRWKNKNHLGEWEEAVAAGGLPAVDVEQLTAEQRAGERIMLELRLKEGVRYGPIREALGVDVEKDHGALLARLEGMGLIERDAGGFRLTEKGIDVADAIAGEFVG